MGIRLNNTLDGVETRWLSPFDRQRSSSFTANNLLAGHLKVQVERGTNEMGPA